MAVQSPIGVVLTAQEAGCPFAHASAGMCGIAGVCAARGYGIDPDRLVSMIGMLDHREELVARGHQFGSLSDTEVILHLYEELGAEAVHRLNGQWAFAIWDSR